jgi:NAD(P)-dependent dehydrogenase (short-subunit alcohol dehydrogenase family)
MGDRLGGKVALITGAARGIGRVAAIAFASEGAEVALVDLDGDELQQLGRDLGSPHVAVAVDVTDEPALARRFDEVRARYGRLDVLYNCAGIHLSEQDGPVDGLDAAIWNRVIGTNLTGTFLACKYGVRLMLRNRRGSIINTGSPTGLSGRGWRHHAYAVSKGGIHALTKAMAVAYGKNGIRVNCVVPGPIRTRLTAQEFSDKEQVARLTSRSPLRRLGEPADLVGIALYLASDESAFATGGMYIVDGGIHVS